MAVRVRLPRHNSIVRRTRSLRVLWAPSLMRRLLRRREVWLVGLVVVAVSGSLWLHAQTVALDDARASWGESARFVVVSEAVERGDTIEGALELRELPVAMAPPDAMRTLPPTGLATAALHVGEVVVKDRITTTGSFDQPDGTVVMTMAVALQVPLISEGDLIDLWAVDSVNLSSRRVAKQVTVLAFTNGAVTVAVPRSQVGDATAASLRPVTVTLVGR